MMPFSDSTSSTHSLVSVLRRAWQRYLTVNTDDPVRKTKNQGILLIIAGLCAMTPVGTIYGDSVFIQILSLALGLLIAACAIPTRRGSTVGAWMLVILLTIGLTPAFLPSTYIGPPLTVPVLILLPSALAAITVQPRYGVPVSMINIALFVAQAALAGYPPASLIPFAIIGTTNLIVMLIPIMVLTTLFTRALRERVAINATLEQRVDERTADLIAANDFIERRANERVQQVAAVVHDLRNTGVMVDSILSLGEMDIEDAQQAIEKAVSAIQNNISAFINQVVAVSPYATNGHSITEKPASRPLDEPDPDLMSSAQATNGHPTSEEPAPPIETIEMDLATVSEHFSALSNAAQRAIKTLARHYSTLDQAIRATMENQQGLLSDMLDMAQLEADAIILRPAIVDLQSLAADVAHLSEAQAAKKYCSIVVSTNDAVPVICDFARIKRVLYNIIGNALKYTSAYRPDGGGEILVEVTREAGQAVCRVRDNGPGIAADDLAKLGQRFQRAERSTAGASGTGLGLHFCKGILAASNGELRIESAGLGQGSCVTITLPISSM